MGGETRYCNTAWPAVAGAVAGAGEGEGVWEVRLVIAIQPGEAGHNHYCSPALVSRNSRSSLAMRVKIDRATNWSLLHLEITAHRG